MRIRWSPAAAADLQSIHAYLTDNHPSLTTSTVQKIYNAAQSLKKFPHRGRWGQVRDTRELIMAPMPYIIVYSVAENMVHILRIIHASEDWPS